MCGSDSRLTYDNSELLSHIGYEYGFVYPTYINCTRTIEAPVKMTVELVAETFSLEFQTEYVQSNETLIFSSVYKVQYQRNDKNGIK